MITSQTCTEPWRGCGYSILPLFSDSPPPYFLAWTTLILAFSIFFLDYPVRPPPCVSSWVLFLFRFHFLSHRLRRMNNFQTCSDPLWRQKEILPNKFLITSTHSYFLLVVLCSCLICALFAAGFPLYPTDIIRPHLTSIMDFTRT